jgi:transcriptional regulator GlxA family with amidase domain
MTRQHISRLCREYGMYRPQWYVSNARLLVAAAYLDDERMSVDAIARELKFNHPSSLYGMFARHTGVEFQTLRTRGIWTFMEERFRDGLRIWETEVVRR